MKNQTRSSPQGRVALTGVLLMVLMPLTGVLLAGKPMHPYLAFPPRTRFVLHPPFHAGVFIAVLLLTVAVIAPWLWRTVRCLRTCPRPAAAPRHRFPWWGWAGFALGAVAWVLAWSRFPWFATLQPHTFFPLWLALILVVNADTLRRSGTCMLTRQPAGYLALFPLSAVFWWVFEFINRFVQNWYYAGVEDQSALAYTLFATISFSTVLPAVTAVEEWLRGFPRLSEGWKGFPEWPVRPRRWILQAGVLLGCAGLLCLPLWPGELFPLVWISPLLVLVCLQALDGQPTLLDPLRTGDGRQIGRFALASLICGFFWELWNLYSLAKWIYIIPYVHAFQLFEMPVLGYAGYLPFGLLCALVAGWVWGPFDPEAPAPPPAAPRRPRRGPVIRAALSLVLATCIWMPLLHLFFRPATDHIHAQLVSNDLYYVQGQLARFPEGIRQPPDALENALLLHLSAADLTPGPLTEWPNRGTLGGTFHAMRSPLNVVERDEGRAVRFYYGPWVVNMDFQTMVADTYAPPSLDDGSPYSMAVWIYGASPIGIDIERRTFLSWRPRGGDGGRGTFMQSDIPTPASVTGMAPVTLEMRVHTPRVSGNETVFSLAPRQAFSRVYFEGETQRALEFRYATGNEHQPGAIFTGANIRAMGWNNGHPPEAGQWQHLAFVYDGHPDGQAQLYVNGQLHAQRGFYTLYTQAGLPMFLGTAWNTDHGTRDLFSRSLNSLRVYDYARTEEEIASAAREGSTR